MNGGNRTKATQLNLDPKGDIKTKSNSISIYVELHAKKMLVFTFQFNIENVNAYSKYKFA